MTIPKPPPCRDADMPELKPCPFCGEMASLTNVRMSDHTFYVGCTNEHCAIEVVTARYDKAEHAISAWNQLAAKDGGK